MVDLAVAVVIGAAFGAVVPSLVVDILTSILGIPGKADFSNLTFTINESVLRYGRFVNAVISFVSIAGAVSREGADWSLTAAERGRHVGFVHG